MDDMIEDEPEDDPESWKAIAHVTNANYQAKKMVFLLFINRKAFSYWQVEWRLKKLGLDRLVDSSRLKRAFEAVYNGILPKGASPFIYLRFAKRPVCRHADFYYNHQFRN
jgi:DNA mismatch repair protein MLH1